MNPTRISELKTEIFEDAYIPVKPHLKITLTDNTKLTIINYKLTTNNHQQNNNTCNNLTQKLKSEK
ncbi:hypothetical protein C6497_05470 [Candidatus Poribacteria bacterium]|nr:MAG: hypothetical protein C6497_05470 [Candidatus Poribacteria bacterium]